MTPKHINQLRDLLVEAIDRYLATTGLSLLTGVFHLSDGKCCPLTCLVGNRGYAKAYERLSQLLKTNVSPEEVWDFVHAFDRALAFGQLETPMTLLGKEIRLKYAKSIVNVYGKPIQ